MSWGTYLPLYFLGSRREALTLNSEVLKDKIKEFYRPKRYYPISDSSIEGHLADIKFRSKDEGFREIWVEIKDTDISLDSKDFRTDLAKYIIRYFQLPPKNRFRLLIVALDIPSSNRPRFESIFTDLDVKKIRDLISQIDMDLKDQMFTKLVSRLSIDELREFFAETEVNIVFNINKLQQAIEKQTPKVPERPTIYDLQYAQHLIRKFEEKRVLLKKDNVIGNFFPILKLPPTIWKAESKFREKREVFQLYGTKNFPPFILKEKFLYSWSNLNSSTHLRKLIDQNTIHRLNTEEWRKEYPKYCVELINLTINIRSKSRILRFDREKKCFYYLPNYSLDGKPTTRVIEWYPSNHSKLRKVVIPRHKDGEFKHFAHRAVVVYSTYMWNSFFVVLRPVWVFSQDGLNLFVDIEHKRLEEKYRKSIMTRNPHQKNNVKFWHWILFRKNYQIRKERLKKRGIEDLEFGDLFEISIDWKPNWTKPPSLTKKRRFLPSEHLDSYFVRYKT